MIKSRKFLLFWAFISNLCIAETPAPGEFESGDFCISHIEFMAQEYEKYSNGLPALAVSGGVHFDPLAARLGWLLNVYQASTCPAEMLKLVPAYIKALTASRKAPQR